MASAVTRLFVLVSFILFHSNCDAFDEHILFYDSMDAQNVSKWEIFGSVCESEDENSCPSSNDCLKIDSTTMNSSITTQISTLNYYNISLEFGVTVIVSDYNNKTQINNYNDSYCQIYYKNLHNINNKWTYIAGYYFDIINHNHNKLPLEIYTLPSSLNNQNKICIKFINKAITDNYSCYFDEIKLTADTYNGPIIEDSSDNDNTTTDIIVYVISFVLVITCLLLCCIVFLYVNALKASSLHKNKTFDACNNNDDDKTDVAVPRVIIAGGQIDSKVGEERNRLKSASSLLTTPISLNHSVDSKVSVHSNSLNGSGVNATTNISLNIGDKTQKISTEPKLGKIDEKEEIIDPNKENKGDINLKPGDVTPGSVTPTSTTLTASAPSGTQNKLSQILNAVLSNPSKSATGTHNHSRSRNVKKMNTFNQVPQIPSQLVHKLSIEKLRISKNNTSNTVGSISHTPTVESVSVNKYGIYVKKLGLLDPMQLTPFDLDEDQITPISNNDNTTKNKHNNKDNHNNNNTPLIMTSDNSNSETSYKGHKHHAAAQNEFNSLSIADHDIYADVGLKYRYSKRSKLKSKRKSNTKTYTSTHGTGMIGAIVGFDLDIDYGDKINNNNNNNDNKDNHDNNDNGSSSSSSDDDVDCDLPQVSSLVSGKSQLNEEESLEFGSDVYRLSIGSQTITTDINSNIIMKLPAIDQKSKRAQIPMFMADKSNASFTDKTNTSHAL